MCCLSPQSGTNAMTRFPELEFLWRQTGAPPAGLPRGRTNESYSQYLRRVPLLAGLRAQATRGLRILLVARGLHLLEPGPRRSGVPWVVSIFDASTSSLIFRLLKASRRATFLC